MSYILSSRDRIGEITMGWALAFESENKRMQNLGEISWKVATGNTEKKWDDRKCMGNGELNLTVSGSCPLV
jgi:hypothetical protein